MSTIDLSRLAFDAHKHYAGVRTQQGRVLTDDDFNEAAAIDAEELRRGRLHAIGAFGSPDAGFLPQAFTVSNGVCDFTLTNGQLYLGGLRLEMTSADRFIAQKDWLDFDRATGSRAPPAAGATRIDLVWIEAWQQPVTAVEDGELVETALGGPDTTVRWRTMRRVHLAAGIAGHECQSAWAALCAGLADGTLDETLELTTTATLRVSFVLPTATGDLCSPPRSGGYLGAENQAIRVQMVDASHYTWGFDNAAPFYRVQVTTKNGQRVKVKLQNQPRDAVHWPVAGQVVEVLPWSAALANGQRVAALTGHLCKVAVSYNPDDRTLEIDTPLAPGFGLDWKLRPDLADFFDAAKEQPGFFLRVWNRGDDLSSPAAIPIATHTLGNTGLSVHLSGGPLRKADYWVIAARPATPEVLTPWVLKSGAAPAGVRRWRAPLALVEWRTTGTVTTGKVLYDCRPPFLPLTRLRGCCSVTVGDGIESAGQFASINQAIAALPPGGGTVCVLPGRYAEAVRLDGLHNVTLQGCGVRARIVAPDDTGADSTAVWIKACSDVKVEALALEGGAEPVLRIDDSVAVRIADTLVQFRDRRESVSPWPAIFAEGRGLEFEGNIIEPLPATLPGDLERVFNRTAEVLRAREADTARGGIQLAGGCAQVRIAGNLIVGGAGNGITLGSIRMIDDKHQDGIDIPDITVENPCAGCDPVDQGPPVDYPPASGENLSYESAGDLYDIAIVDNVIARHGANGIGVVRYFGPVTKALAKYDTIVLVAVHGLHIAFNAIQYCLRRRVALAPAGVRLYQGYGGIALAFTTDLVIAHNLIARNGRDWLSPVCGIFVLAADGLRIEHNQIRANGEAGEGPVASAQPGLRAGIHVWLALSRGSAPGTGFTARMMADKTGDGPGGNAQIRVHANAVEQPLGRALFMLGAGPMLISDNHLLSEGAGPPATDPFANSVLIGNVGLSREWTPGLVATLILILRLVVSGQTLTSAQRLELENKICDYAKRSRFMPGVWPALPSGKVLFNDNQVGFMMRDAPYGLDASSTLLVSLDDLGASGNQLDYHAQQRIVVADLLALAPTVRTSDNRLAETWGRALCSGLSLGLMNTAADNQSTHCILAYGLEQAVHHNLALAEVFCRGACGKPDKITGAFVLGAKMYANGQP